jgi:hypothetical protein
VVHIGANAEVLSKLRRIARGVPEVDIGARRGKGKRNVADRFTVLSEDQKVVVNIIAVVKGNIAVGGLRAPDFGGNVNHAGPA